MCIRDSSFAGLPEAFYTRLAPHGLPAPYLVAASNEVAELVGLDPREIERPEFREIFAGNSLPPGSDALAAVYSGHQFGVWAGQLGDGRAHLLGGLRSAHGHWEIQLKGAGRTPYSLSLIHISRRATTHSNMPSRCCFTFCTTSCSNSIS